MKKILRNTTTMLLILTLFMGLSSTKVDAQEFISEASLLSRQDNVFTYYLKENNEEITLAFDVSNDIVTVNNTSYSIESYNSAVADQATDLSRNPITYYLKIYPQINNITKENDSVIINRSPAPPTTGYGKEYKTALIRKVNWGFALTSAAFIGVATYMTGGNIDAAKKLTNAIIMAAVSAGLVAIDGIFYNNIYTQHYQAYHLTVYGAVRERKETVTYVGSQYFPGGYSTSSYFWSINPY